MDTEIIGVSANARFSQQAFADFLKLNFPLLSDAPDLKTAQDYGVFNADRKLAQRSYFIIDKQGVVRYKVTSPVPEARNQDEYLKVLAEL